MASASFLDRSNSIAPPGFNRWLVPPAALCIHLCIGQAYAFSVFNKPMAAVRSGVTATGSPGDWSIAALGWIFSLAIVFLGLSAAFGGSWVERVGPRKAMFVVGAVLLRRLARRGAAASRSHQLWLVYLGLRRDRRLRSGHRLHLAGLDADQVVPRPAGPRDRHGDHGLRRRRADRRAARGRADEALLQSPTSTGVAPTMLTMGVIYFVFMMVGAFIVRVPARGLAARRLRRRRRSRASADHHAQRRRWTQAIKTPQFWLLWVVLFLNVTAGIGVLGQASLMIQEMFGVTAVARRPASSACSASSTWAAASSGPRCPTSWAASRPT